MSCNSRGIRAQVMLLLIFWLPVVDLFAQPGKDGTLTISSGTHVVNRYAPVISAITPGTSSLVIAPGPSFSLCAGDLIMIYQAQGATISTTNSPVYGDITSYNSAGLFEFKYVKGVVGSTVETQTTFTNTYLPAGKVQVIKVPQYSSLVLNANTAILAKPWKDTTIASVPCRFGGLVVIHAASITNNGLISASHAGFRGGIANANLNFTLGITDFVSAVQIFGGTKGEGIAGAPADYDLMGGRYCRGAPANGGGGGTSTNASGGGGANGNNMNVWTGQGVMISNSANPVQAWSLDPGYISNANALTNSSGGGRGGYSWGNTNSNALTHAPGSSVWQGDNRREVGGRGGRPLTNIDPETRIYFGGGGGAGDANNNGGTSGGNGGGIIYLICSSAVTGTGTIESNGFSVPLSVGCHCDGHGGGGSGGSIVIKTNNISPAQTVQCVGGLGGSQFTVSPPGMPSENEGPGGGGGGGFIAIPATGVTPNVDGGMNGTTASPGLTEFPFNGATAGAKGHTATVSGNFITYQPLQVFVSSPVCLGGPVSFSVSASGVVTYFWSGPHSFTSGVASPTIANTTTLSGGIYTVQVTYSNSCTLSNTFAVTVNPGPAVSISGPDTVCTGGTVTLVAQGADSYTWFPASVVTDSLVVSPPASTVYTVTGNDSLGCRNTATFVLHVAQNPVITISAPQASLCYGQSLSLGATGAQSYSWYPGPVPAPTVVVSPTANIVYTVTGASSHHCIGTTTISVFVHPLPTLTVSGPDDSVCPGETFTLSAAGAHSYTWNPGSFGQVQTHSVSQQTTFTVSGSTSQGCTAYTTIVVDVKPVPLLGFATASITCAHLGFGTVTASGGGGPFSYTWMPTAQSGSAASGLYPGTYTISVHDGSTGCLFTPTVSFSPLVPLDGTVAATPSVPCYGDLSASASILLSGGSGSQTYTWIDAHGVQTTPSVSSIAAGVNTVTVTDVLTHCMVTHTFLIVQPDAISPTITATSATVCLGGQITLTATASGGVPPFTYSWTGGSPGSTLVLAETVAGSQSYTVTVTDANNCQGLAPFTGSFIANPTVSVNSLTVCPLESGTLAAGGAATYTWNTGATGANLVIYPAASVQFTVNGDLNGCRSVAIADVSVKGVPMPSIAADHAICEDDTLVLTGSGGSFYAWTGPAGFTSSLSQPTIMPAGINHTGVYTMTVTGVNGCTASSTASVEVNPLPVVTAGSSTVCAGDAVVLWAGYISGSGYSWTGPLSFVSSQQNITFQSSHQAMSGIYTVIVTSPDGCRATGSSTLLVVEPPVYTLQGAAELCAGDTLFLSAPAADSYLWLVPGGVLGNAADLVVPGITASTQFTLLITAAPCTVRLTHSVTVNQNPQPQAVASAQSPCESSEFILWGSLPQVTNTWNGPLISAVVSPTLIISPHSVSSSGIYTLSVVDSNGCSGSDTIMIGIRYGPELTVQGATVCLGQQVSLSATGADTYQWTGPGGYTSSGNPVSFLPANFLASGLYTVVGSDSGPCTGIEVTHVLIKNAQAPAVSLQDTVIIACIRSFVNLAALGGSDFLWTGPGGFESDSSRASVWIGDNSHSGTYTLSVRNDSACIATRTLAVSVFPEIPVNFGISANNRCVPFCSTVYLENATGAQVSYSLFVEDLYAGDGMTELCIYEAGTRELQVRYTDTNQCVSSYTLGLTGLEKPRADFSFHPDHSVAGLEEVNFYNESEGAARSVWITGNGNRIDTSIAWDHSYNFDSAGIFPVVLVVESRNGCSDTIIRAIHVAEEFAIYFPNTFTPGGDGLNDVFQPKGSGITGFEMSVFDRWGEHLFTTGQFDQGWNGTFRGKDCKEDIYVWKAVVSGSKTVNRHYSGYVLLLRDK